MLIEEVPDWYSNSSSICCYVRNQKDIDNYIRFNDKVYYILSYNIFKDVKIWLDIIFIFSRYSEVILRNIESIMKLLAHINFRFTKFCINYIIWRLWRMHKACQWTSSFNFVWCATKLLCIQLSSKSQEKYEKWDIRFTVSIVKIFHSLWFGER